MVAVYTDSCGRDQEQIGGCTRTHREQVACALTPRKYVHFLLFRKPMGLRIALDAKWIEGDKSLESEIPYFVKVLEAPDSDQRRFAYFFVNASFAIRTSHTPVFANRRGPFVAYWPRASFLHTLKGAQGTSSCIPLCLDVSFS